MSSTDKITREEMMEMFGETMPMEAVKLVWESPDDMTVGEVRSALRDIAARYAEEREAERVNHEYWEEQRRLENEAMEDHFRKHPLTDDFAG